MLKVNRADKPKKGNTSDEFNYLVTWLYDRYDSTSTNPSPDSLDKSYDRLEKSIQKDQLMTIIISLLKTAGYDINDLRRLDFSKRK